MESRKIHLQHKIEDKYKVLVVDDEKLMRNLLKKMIEEFNDYSVDLAEDAEEALKKYKKKVHQIIVLDIRLGGNVSGLDLLKKIKQYDKLVNIIMITGYGTIDVAVECMKAGAWDFITKPFSFDYLEIVLKKAVENLQLKKIAEERDYFRDLSRLDSLTEIYNRRFFDTMLRTEYARAKRYQKEFSLLLIDLDKFKSINDRFGHQKGDLVLKAVASLMKEVSRESDYVCRYGGDEFAVILPETGEEGALIYSHRLRQKVGSLEIVEKGETENFYEVSMSIGVVSYPASTDSLRLLIEFADAALFEAKKNEEKIIFFNKKQD